MNITVCVKQVPGTTEVEVDPETGVLKRDGVDSKMNPYDLYALETALRFRDENNANITALTMGPPQAEEIIREAFMMGADRGLVLSDRRFAGADVLSTAYTLAQGIRHAGMPELIICGKQTTDGDTAQVGAEIAEFLNIPHLTNVVRIVEVKTESLIVEVDMPQHLETAEIPFPCLIAVDKDIFEPRLPSYRLKLATADKPVEWLSLDELKDTDAKHYGLNGSPTQVIRIFPPENDNERELWEGNGELLAKKLFDKLKDMKFLQQTG